MRGGHNARPAFIREPALVPDSQRQHNTNGISAMQIRTRSIVALAASVLMTGLVPSAHAQTAAEMEQLQKDVASIKQGQDALRKDVEEIKKLLQARPAPAAPAAQTIDAVLEIGGQPMMGSPDAKVTLIEFTDYQCPYCKRYAQDTLPEIKKGYIDTGKVRYVARDLPLSMHKKAPKAAEAAHCAGDQGKYWQMHDSMFAHQDALGPDQLVSQASDLGLNTDDFKACLDSGKHKAAVDASAAEAAKLGITGTPTILIGRSDGDKVKDIKVLRGAQPLATYQARIEEMLAEPGAAKPAAASK
jgi:protein-disulfide isomerase